MDKNNEKRYIGIDIFQIMNSFPKRMVTERNVLMGLCSFLNVKRSTKTNSYKVFPDVATLAKKLKTWPWTVTQAIERLRSEGYLVVTKEDGVETYDLKPFIEKQKDCLSLVSGNDPFLVIPIVKRLRPGRSNVIATEVAMALFFGIDAQMMDVVEINKSEIGKKIGRSNSEIGAGFKVLEECCLIRKIKIGCYDLTELYLQVLVSTEEVDSKKTNKIKSQSELEWEETTAIANRWAKA